MKRTKDLVVATTIHLALVVAILNLVTMPVVAAAQTLDWDVQETVDTASGANGSNGFSALKAGRVYTNNDLGASILRLDSDNVSSDTVFGVPWGEQVVYAKYEPATSTGTIFIARSLRLQNGDGVLEVAQWTPDYFDAYSQDFTVANGAICQPLNPFHEFAGSNGSGVHTRGMFKGINLQAFKVAVGMVMQHVGASEGWIAYSETRTEKEEHHDGGFFKKTITIEFDAYTKPKWILATPTNIGSGRNVSAVIAVPNSSEASVKNCIANNPKSIGVARSTQYEGSSVGGVKLLAGVNFITEGAQSNMPHNEFHAFHHEESQSGFGSFAIIAATTAFGIIGTIAMGEMSGNFSLESLYDDAFNFGYPDEQVPDGQAFTPISNGLQNVANSNVQYGNVDNSDYENGNANIVTIDLDRVETQAYVGDSSSGRSTSEHAGRPLHQNDEWDPYPEVAREVARPFGQTGGGFVIHADRTKPDPGEMASKSVMSVMQRELGETLNYDTSPYGDPQDY